MEQQVAEYFARGGEPATARELGKALGYVRTPGKLKTLLDRLTEEGRLARTGERYCSLEQAGLAAGTFWDSGRGYGFLTPDGAASREEDLFLPPRCSGGAWHGDRVLAEREEGLSREGRPTARVVRILARASQTVTGRVQQEGREYWLIPDGGRLPELKLTGGRSGLRPGDKAEARVLSHGGGGKPPLAAFVRSFGRDGTRQAAVEAILARNAVPRAFSRQALEEAGRLPETVSAAARRGRLDLRERRIITIDGPAAKDLDDAVSLERDPEGNWVLGVHIADVSHYVKAGSALDQEALARGTSVYFADQVIPMLPERLSNGICSLNPRVDRLTLSCIMTLDRRGQVLSHQIVQSVIRTAERMSYPDCNRLLAGEEPELAERYREVLPMLRDMEALSRALERRRRLRGALDLESAECQVICGPDGEPVELVRRTPGASEGIIESFMLAANECVARHLAGLGKPGVYRIHERPTSDKLEQFRRMVAPFGYTLATPDSFGLQKVMDQARGRPEEGAVSMLLLRSLMKARYAPENLGHFGLGAEYYCHFTSPIRRYPDLMVHRILTALLEGRLEGARERKLAAAAAEAAGQSSLRETAAETAERDIEKCYRAEYMLRHVGERFTGVVSGVTRFGVFVLVDGGVEGLVPLQLLPEDRYEYDPDRMTLTGAATGKAFTFAMPLEVRCLSADPGTGEVTFGLEGAEAPPGKRADAPEQGREPREKRSRRGKAGRRAVHVPGRAKKGKGKR